MKNLYQGLYYFLILGAVVLIPKSGFGKPEFPKAEYQRIERSAMSNGYGDIASSVALIFRYREVLDRCDTPKDDASDYLFAEFLDSFANTVNGYMNMSGIWRPQVRSSAEFYVGNASVLIQMFIEKKIAKFGEGPLDKEMLAMCPKMHSRLASLLRVGANSEGALKQKWQSADLTKFLADPKWGKIAKALRQLDSETSPACQTP